MRRRAKPQLITDAPRSPEDELRAREVRYVIMMLLRAACIIVGTVLLMLRVPLLPLWLAICVAGAVVLPWAAVLLANDKAPRESAKLRNKLHHQREPEPEPRALTPTESTEHKVIDVDPPSPRSRRT